ncbi:elongation factor mitochondrial [Brachionus plicatilis]|uniref:Elongation factor Ts, mitochondrial n=1 Tax=Brachionus plicatilis TaxID=10195 RepID=A0A3M7SZY8_BRAPC|nr:elongation factor mitochondrial [Brachionus plicatilis]
MFVKLLNQITIKPSLVRSICESKSLLQEAKGSSSNLFKLRKSTGYALNKCKEALEKNEGDIEAATKWLNEQAQKEGWSKAEKLKNRQTKQGTLVLYAEKEKNLATLVELNCETDFVARNEKFLDLSSHLAKSILWNAPVKGNKELIEKEELNKIKFLDQNKTLGDQIALAIGTLGENMSIRRAVVLSLREDEKMGWYMHGSITDPMNNCHFGKYGALVNFRLTQKNENYKTFDIGRQIAQHVVGMKPLTLGEMPVEEVNLDEPVKIDDNETRLLYQEFLMKPNTRVLDFINENHAKINDFVRLECGEILENDENK